MPNQWTEDDLRKLFTGELDELVAFRNRLRRIPSSPRCKLCAAPFEGLGGQVLRHFGFGRFPGNEALCRKCIVDFERAGITGAEIPLTLLFADIRGSTTIGEKLRPAEFRAFLQHFYDIALRVVLDHDGIVDKLVGDEVIALFFGGVSGPRHAAAAVAAGRKLLERASAPNATPSGPIPLGVAIHGGDAYVGTVGATGAARDFTAVGDAVNTAARLVTTARAGELLVSEPVLEAAEIWAPPESRRTVDVRGREGKVTVAAIVSPRDEGVAASASGAPAD